MTEPPLLDVRGLGISFLIGGQTVEATRDVSFAVQPGERVGIVGESGCGKTITGLSLLGLLPPATTRVRGEAIFGGENLVGMKQSKLRHVRGRRISMIFQEPMSALDPVFTIGQQIGETIRTHSPSTAARPANAPSRRSRASASRAPPASTTATPTSSPAACASAP